MTQQPERDPNIQIRYEKISKLAEMGKKIDQKMKNSVQHLNDFMSLGLKTEDPFEFKRAVAEVNHIIKLATEYQTIITRAHEIAEGDMQEQDIQSDPATIQGPPSQSTSNTLKVPPIQRKPSPASMGMQEQEYTQGGSGQYMASKCKCGHPRADHWKDGGCSKCDCVYFKNSLKEYRAIALTPLGNVKAFEILAESAQEAILLIRQQHPAWEIQRVFLREESPSGKSDKPDPKAEDPKKKKKKDYPSWWDKIDTGDVLDKGGKPGDYMEEEKQSPQDVLYCNDCKYTFIRGKAGRCPSCKGKNLTVKQPYWNKEQEDPFADDAEAIDKAPGQGAKGWYENIMGRIVVDRGKAPRRSWKLQPGGEGTIKMVPLNHRTPDHEMSVKDFWQAVKQGQLIFRQQ